jgi:hypothetical protein
MTTTPVRVKLSLSPLSGVVWALPVLKSPLPSGQCFSRGYPQAALSRSRLAAIPGASATHSPHPFHNTARASIKLHQSAPAAQLHLCISDQAITPYHNPLNPTTSVDFFLLWHSHSRAVLFGSLLRLSISTQHIFQSPFRHPIQTRCNSSQSSVPKSHPCPRPDLFQNSAASPSHFVILLRQTRSLFCPLLNLFESTSSLRLFVAFTPIGLEWPCRSPD